MSPRPIPPARKVALACLDLTFERNMDIQLALDQSLVRFSPSPADARLATELAYGYARMRGRIDYVLDRFLKNPRGIRPGLRLILGVAAYELIFLDRVPAHASVTWAVDRVAKRYGKKLSGLANAVLRNVDRLGPDVHAENLYREHVTSEAGFLALYYSCPLWIVEQWYEQWGHEATERFCAAQAAPAPLGVRVNMRAPRHAALRDKLAANEYCIHVHGPALAFSRPHAVEDLDALLQEGRLSRQSAASQEALLALDPSSWEPPVWDCCAGSGGKSFLLLEQGHTPVIATDAHAGRVARIATEARRLNLTPAWYGEWDATGPTSPEHKANTQQPQTVIIDAPCSGLGVLSRRPDAKWKRTPTDVAQLIDLQRHILAARADSLPAGGRLVYITCTTNHAENEEQVRTLVRTHGLREGTGYQTDTSSPLGEYFFSRVLQK